MKFNKPKFWDKKSSFISIVLFPLTLITLIINIIKKKITITKKFNVPIICVGNIYIGGTGKTSLSIKINEILNKKKIKSCIVKKFYKNQIDEQKVLKNHSKLFLSLKRLDAIKQAENENYEIAILDDGLQDQSIFYDIRIVCFNNINCINSFRRCEKFSSTF